MIIGAHALIYSRNAAADRKFLREVLKLRSIDAGGGWPIFALPPTELAVHPTDGQEHHELYLLCDDMRALVRDLGRRGIACAPLQEARWGIVTEVTLPSGGRVHIYQPLHPSPFKRPRVAVGHGRRRRSGSASAPSGNKRRRRSGAEARNRPASSRSRK